MVLEEKVLTTSEDNRIFCRIKESGQSKWLIATHGIGEHSGRHTYLLELFSQDFNILLYDLRGHGQSSGKRGDIRSFEEFYSDLEFLINFLQKDYAMKEYDLFGHSMGGLITCGFIQKKADKLLYPSKVYISSPPVAVGGAAEVFSFLPQSFLESLANLPFSIKLPPIIDGKKLSHDPRVGEEYIKDPHNIMRLYSRLIFNLISESKDVYSRPLKCLCPLYVSVGSKDQIVSPKAVEKYFTTIEKNASFEKIEGGRHELQNEIQKYRQPFFTYLKRALNSGDILS